MSKVDEHLVRVRVVLLGREPGMIQQRMKEQDDSRGAAKKTGHGTKEQEAEASAHWVKSGNGRSLAIPWVALYRSICAASASPPSTKR